MRLIDVHTFRLVEFHDCTQIKYAILSHRWEEQEILYKDMIQADGKPDQLKSMKGYHKIRKSCHEAATRGYQYVWVDTCCIDKSSSAELQEAINSMFRWYACAEICFAFLSDVRWSADPGSFDKSQWFERGWTLQELLAPRHLVFFDTNWQRIDSRRAMATPISVITGIPDRFLHSSFNPNWKVKSRPCIAAIMSWASNRKTTRLEDRAYSLLGLFDVNMPMLYGEGEKSFYRLQVALLQQSEDQSIFAWDNYSRDSVGLLATSPSDFRSTKATALLRCPYSLIRRLSSHISSEGVHLEVRLVPVYPKVYMALFNLSFFDFGDPIWLGPEDSIFSVAGHIGIYVFRLDDSRFARILSPFTDSVTNLAHWPSEHQVSQLHNITVVRRLGDEEMRRVSQGMQDIQQQRERLERINFHPDKPSKGKDLENDGCVDITLDVATEQNDFWMNWMKSKAIEPLGMHGDEGFSKFHQWFFDNKQLKIQLLGSVLFALIKNDQVQSSFPFGAFVVGFDFDSKFLCFVTTHTSKASIRATFQELLCLPDGQFARHEPVGRDRIAVKSCVGGRYHNFNEDVVAFKRESHTLAAVMTIEVQMSTGVTVQFSVDKQNSHWSIYIMGISQAS